MESRKQYKTELFMDRESAEKAYDAAIAQGYTPEEVNVIMSEESRNKYYGSDLVNEKLGDKSMEGLAIGGSLGGVIGGTLAAIAAIGMTIAMPGIGLIVSGPLAAGIAGAGVGSIAGGLIGTLIGWGVDEDRAKIYEKGIKHGGIVLSVEDRADRKALATEWDKYRATEEV